MKTIVTLEIETPDEETVQAYASALGAAKKELAARGYTSRIASCKIVTSVAPGRAVERPS